MDEETEPVEDAAGEEEHKPRLSRRKLILIVGPIVVLAIVGTATTAMTPYLASHHQIGRAHV